MRKNRFKFVSLVFSGGLALSSLVLFGTTLSGCADLNDPYYGSGPSYGDPYYDGYYDRNRDERRRLERERERLENERDRLERERDRANHYPPPPPPVSRRPSEDRCPSGYSPSERKCSNEERRHGCRDIRLPSGLGCVSR